MNRPQRLALLEDLQELRHREAENVDPIRKFLPLPNHRLALRPEIVVVRGVRGAGKSALFRVLHQLGESARLRDFFDDDRLPDATWIDAFSQRGIEHPEVATLDAFGQPANDADLRTFWMGHLLRRLTSIRPAWQELVPAPLHDAWREGGHDVASWIPAAQEHLAAVSHALDTIERRLIERDELIFATYDHLDRIGAFKPDVRRRYVSSLLALWLSLSNRYSKLRAKIFIREDLFRAGELGFPDATKLRARSVALDWDVGALYRVVIRHVANTSEPMRAWLKPLRLELREHGEFGWMVGDLPETHRKRFADRLAGELMGRGVKKGYTYRWIPNRLQDAQGQIVPRSILCLVGFAAEEAARHPLSKGTRLVTPQDLLSALEPTSRERVAEIKEEFALVERIENLRGRRVLMDPEEAMGQLGEPVAGEPDGLPLDGKQVFDELLRLGVISVRKDGRVDVPDIYRYGYGILRKGGVARPR